MCNEIEMENIFQEIGKKHGYDKVTAKYVEFKDFKLKWQRSYKWAEFAVSDYISEAPENVIESLAETIFTKITGSKMKPYTEQFCNFVLSPEFAKRWQPIYMKRSRNIEKTAAGKSKNLNDGFRRLIDCGLVDNDDDIIFSWTKDESLGNVSYCSTMMKVVVISKGLDSGTVPDFVLDYVIYRELKKMTTGRDLFNSREPCYSPDEIASDYPKAKEAEEWISRLYMKI